MKILLVLGNLSRICGANVNIMMTLVKHLKTNNDIYVLTRYNDASPLDPLKVEQFTNVTSFFLRERERISAFKKKYYASDTSLFRKILLVLSSFKAILWWLDTKYNDNFLIRKRYVKELEFLCEKQEFDVVLGLSSPNYIFRVVADANISAKKAVIQLDPYAYDRNASKFMANLRRRREMRALEKLDLLFTLPIIYNDIKEKGLTPNMEKIVPFQLPGIIVDKQNSFVAPGVGKGDGTLVHFMFLGLFYDDIRNPSFLLKLFTRLPSNYILHIVGGGSPRIINSYKPKLGSRLVCHGWVGNEEAKKHMQEADFLVNVNNTVKNQFASKLFDYINTGKPILNICKQDACLSVEYTNRYKNSINIVESEKITGGLLDRISDFVSKHKGVVIAPEVIFEEFRENTDSYVADLMEKNLQDLFKN